MPRVRSRPAPANGTASPCPSARRGTHPVGWLCRGGGGSSPASPRVSLCFIHPGSSGRAPGARVSRRQQEKGRSILARATSSPFSTLPSDSSWVPPCERPRSNQEPKENTE